MPKLKLTYFDFHGGRGEPIRLAMFIGGVEFEDDRISFPEFRERKSDFLYGRVPILEVDGAPLAQSGGISRFVGKLAGLYPDDPWQAALCDEAIDAVEDVSHEVIPTFSIEDEDEKKKARQVLADGTISFSLGRLARRLGEHGGKFFADGRLTVADLKVFVWLRFLRSGQLDHVDVELPDRVAPLLVEHNEAIKSHPKIVEYYATFGSK